MDYAALSDLLARACGLRVLCAGDLLLDSFAYGEARGLSREAPVAVMGETRRETMLGGAGNVARNVAALGGRAELVSVIGDDAEGGAAARLAHEAGAGGPGLIVEAGRATPAKTRFVSAGQQMLCVDRDPRGAIAPATEARAAAAIAEAAARCDVAILSDYGRGFVTPALARAAVEACRAAGVKLLVDPRGRDFTRYDGAFLIKPNALELSLEAGMPAETDAEAEAALAAVRARLPETEHLLVTRSWRGMSVMGRNGRATHLRSRPREVYDVSGAGDTTLAMLALACAAGSDIDGMMEAADRAAGVVVGKLGTATASPEEILDAERALAPRAGAEKIVSAAAAQADAERWRAAGLKVAEIEDAFDILTPTVLARLDAARTGAARLIARVQADAEGCVNDARARADVLAAVRGVDRVVLG